MIVMKKLPTIKKLCGVWQRIEIQSDPIIEFRQKVIHKQLTQQGIEKHPISSFLNNAIFTDFRLFLSQLKESTVKIHAMDIHLAAGAPQSNRKGYLELNPGCFKQQGQYIR
jgi:hypothetical protein